MDNSANPLPLGGGQRRHVPLTAEQSFFLTAEQDQPQILNGCVILEHSGDGQDAGAATTVVIRSVTFHR